MSRLYTENTHYAAIIESQEFAKGFGDKPQLVLRVRLTGKAKTPNDTTLKDGEEDIAEALKVTRTLYFDLDPAGSKLDKVMQELNTLGFTDSSLPRLHPASRRHHSFKGQKCLVRCWYKEGVGPDGSPTEKEKWFLVTPRNVESFNLEEFEALFRENADAYVNATPAPAKAS